MPYLHFDTEQGRATRERLRQVETAIGEALASLDSAVNTLIGEGLWQAPGATKFEEAMTQWCNQMQTHRETLNVLAIRLEKEIAEWEETAAVFGGGRETMAALGLTGIAGIGIGKDKTGGAWGAALGMAGVGIGGGARGMGLGITGTGGSGGAWGTGLGATEAGIGSSAGKIITTAGSNIEDVSFISKGPIWGKIHSSQSAGIVAAGDSWIAAIAVREKGKYIGFEKSPVEVKGEAYLIKGEKTVGKALYEKGDLKALGYAAKGEYLVGFGKEGFQTRAEVGVKAYLAQVELSREVAGFEVAGDALVGADISGEGKLILNPLKGDAKVELEGGAFAGASVEAGVSQKMGPVAGKIGGEVGVGIGARGKVDFGLEKGTFTYDVGGKTYLGIGGGIEVSGELDIPEAAEDIANIGKEVVDLGKDILDDLGDSFI